MFSKQQLAEQFARIFLNAIDRIVEQTEETWDNAAAIVVRHVVQKILGIKLAGDIPAAAAGALRELDEEIARTEAGLEDQ